MTLALCGLAITFGLGLLQIALGNPAYVEAPIRYCAAAGGVQAMSGGGPFSAKTVLCKNGTTETYRGDTELMPNTRMTQNDRLIARVDDVAAMGGLFGVFVILTGVVTYLVPKLRRAE